MRSAKRLLVPVIVLGLVVAVAVAGAVVYRARQHAAAVSQFRAALARHDRAMARQQSAAGQLHDALTRVGEAHVRLNSVMSTVVNDSRQCLTVSCFAATAADAANANGAFLRTIQGISFPAGAASAAKTFEMNASANERAWTSMSHASSFADYGNRATGAEKSGRAFDSGYTALSKSLAQVGAGLSEQAAALNSESAALRQRAAALDVPVRLRKIPEGPVQSVA